MPKTKIAITLDSQTLAHLDGAAHNRSQFIETAVQEKLQRLQKTRLATECTKLDPAFEQQLADENLTADTPWPAY